MIKRKLEEIRSYNTVLYDLKKRTDLILTLVLIRGCISVRVLRFASASSVQSLTLPYSTSKPSVVFPNGLSSLTQIKVSNRFQHSLNDPFHKK